VTCKRTGFPTSDSKSCRRSPLRSRREGDPRLASADAEMRQVWERMAQEDAANAGRNLGVAVGAVEHQHHRLVASFLLFQVAEPN